MPPITTSAEVDRPAEDVFDYATDPNRFPEWQEGVLGGEMDGHYPPIVGDRCLTTRRIGFADRTTTAELAHIDRPRSWRIRGIDGPIRAVVEVTVEALSAERSRLTIAIDFEGHGIGKLLVPLIVRREARKEMPRNLARLRQRLEQVVDNS